MGTVLTFLTNTRGRKRMDIVSFLNGYKEKMEHVGENSNEEKA